MALPESLWNMQTSLEAVLVQEFRACQNLDNQTKNERQALSSGDVDTLLSIVEQKEAMLDKLDNLEGERRRLVKDIGKGIGLQIIDPALTTILPYLDKETAERFDRIREGIIVLLNNINKVNFGNHALAVSGLERTDAVQAFLLKLYQPHDSYRAPGMPQVQETHLNWSLDQKA
jgi:flagellar biosynthesis/type III secretory pathway chaperone